MAAHIFVDSDNFLAIENALEERKVIGDIGGQFDPIYKVWRVVFTSYNLEYLLDNLNNPTVSNGMEEMLQKQMVKEDKLMRIRAMSKNDVPVKMKIAGIKIPPYNYQKLGVMFAVTNGSGVLIADEMGLGKEFFLNTPVLTRAGWKEIGNLTINDEVYGRDGFLHRITGIFPQGIKEILKITFSDGVCVECGWEHLWMVQSDNHAVRNQGWKVLNTRSLFSDLTLGKKRSKSKWRIPLTEPIRFPTANLSIPPYLMGVLLGDGSLTSGGVVFCPGDKEVPRMVSLILPAGYQVNENADYGTSTRFSVVSNGVGNPMSRAITDMGLRITGEHKFIPDIYKFSDIDQRKELLAGLLDTDGSAMGARTRFSSSSEKLADDVIDLVRSLGGMAVKSLVPGRIRDRDGKKCQELDSWQLTIRTCFNPFRISSNVVKWKRSSKLVRKIVSIQPIKHAEAVCISVDSPDSTYIVKDYIVTHNTNQAISTAVYLKSQGKAKNALIITPASLKFNWPIEIEKFTNEKYVVIDGKPTERVIQWLRNDVFFYVVNFELIIEDLFGGREFKENEEDSFETKRRKEILTEKAEQRERILSPIRTRVWDCLVVDEAHFLRSHSSRRSRSIKALRSHFRMGLTGTPMDGRLEELHSVMGFVAPGLLGSKTRFFQRHVDTDFYGRVTGYKRIGEVTQRIAPFFIRRLKKDVLKELPDKIYQNRIVVLSPEEMKIYKSLADGGHEATEDAQAMVSIIRCKQFCNYPPKIDNKCKKTSKMDSFKEVVDEVVLQNANKALVFTQYKETLNVLAGVLDDMGVKYLRIDGDTPPERRALMQQQFNTDTKLDMMIGTESMSTGLNFTAANHVLNFDDNWSPSIMAQREDRSHRLGQKNTVVVVSFICKDTIEERIRAVIYGKNKITAQTLGDETDEMTLKRLNPKEIAQLL